MWYILQKGSETEKNNIASIYLFKNIHDNEHNTTLDLNYCNTIEKLYILHNKFNENTYITRTFM